MKVALFRIITNNFKMLMESFQANDDKVNVMAQWVKLNLGCPHAMPVASSCSGSCIWDSGWESVGEVPHT